MPTPLGTVTDRYRRIHCVALNPEVTLIQGARVRFTFPGSIHQKPVSFEQEASSIEVSRQQVERVEPGTSCGLKIDGSVCLPPIGTEIVLLD